MASADPQLSRTLFGYRRSSVRQLLADREKMFDLARDRAERAQAVADEARAELEAAHAELEAVRAELRRTAEALHELGERADQAEARGLLLQVEAEAARGGLLDQRRRAEAAEARSAQLQVELDEARADRARVAGQGGQEPVLETEELALILDAAQRGVTGIIDRARRAYEQQLEQAETVRKAIEAEVAKVGEWQVRLAPVIRSLQWSLETAQKQITQVPGQIQEAVESLTDAIGAVGESLDQLAGFPPPPAPGPAIAEAAPADASRQAVIRLEGQRGRDGGSPGGTAGHPEDAESRRSLGR